MVGKQWFGQCLTGPKTHAKERNVNLNMKRNMRAKRQQQKQQQNDMKCCCCPFFDGRLLSKDFWLLFYLRVLRHEYVKFFHFQQNHFKRTVFLSIFCFRFVLFCFFNFFFLNKSHVNMKHEIFCKCLIPTNGAKKEQKKRK